MVHPLCIGKNNAVFSCTVDSSCVCMGVACSPHAMMCTNLITMFAIISTCEHADDNIGHAHGKVTC